MSVFVNLNISANRNDVVRARFESDTNGEDILKDPSEYSVGINRFKIPLTTIPVYRIYEETFALCFNGSVKDSIAPNVGGFNKPAVVDAFDNVLNLDSLLGVSSYGRYGIDRRNENKKYVDIFSQNDWERFMNQVLARAFGNFWFALSGKTTSNNIDVLGYKRYVVNSGLSIDCARGTKSTGDNKYNGVATTTLEEVITADTLANTAENRGEMITGLEMIINNMTFTAGSDGAVMDFADLQFELVRQNSDPLVLDAGDSRRYIIKPYGKLKGLSEIQSGDNSTHLHFSTLNGYIDADEMFDAELHTNNKGNTGNKAFFLFPSSLGVNGLLGLRADGYTYKLLIKNRLARKLGADDPNDKCPKATFPAGGIKYIIHTQKYSFIDKGDTNNIYAGIELDYTNLSQNYSATLSPSFSLGSDGKFSYNQNNLYGVYADMTLYMNNALASLFSFNNLVSRNITLRNQLEIFTAVDLGRQEQAKGVVFSLSPRLGEIADDGSVIELGESVEYKEGFDSKFSRDWLNSILITTGRLAVNGEFTGDGGSKRRVLTDFEIDPSSVSRDYLVFTNQGGMRLYGLNSNLPIKEIDAQVLYQDIYGVVRPLEVSPFEECSLKVEFRPNSQIYNSQQNISSFDFVN